jgi:hypothetical protein
MTEWCPKCHAMLPPGLETCPACGAKLRKKAGKLSVNMGSDQYTGRDIFWLSAYIVGIALIPILVAIGLGILCMLLNR